MQFSNAPSSSSSSWPSSVSGGTARSARACGGPVSTWASRRSELAARLDASQAYVSQVEHGKGLSVEQLRLFAEALEEAAKGDEEDAGRKRQRKRTRGS